MSSRTIREDLRSPWLRAIVGIVAVAVSVNMGFVVYAFLSPPNLVVADYYERGKNYFHEQAIRDRAAATAWRLELSLPDRIAVGETITGRLHVVDHRNRPVSQGRVEIAAYRPSDARQDFKIVLSPDAAGLFSGRLRFPLPGSWDLIARIEAFGEQYDIAQRVFVEK